MEFERQQGPQLLPVIGQVIEDLCNRCVHGLKGVMPAAQRFFADEFPQPFDEVEVGRIGWQELEHEQ